MEIRVLCASITYVLTWLALWLTLSASAVALNKRKVEVSPQREQSPPGCRTTCPLCVAHCREPLRANPALCALSAPVPGSVKDLSVCCSEVWTVFNVGTNVFLPPTHWWLLSFCLNHWWIWDTIPGIFRNTSFNTTYVSVIFHSSAYAFRSKMEPYGKRDLPSGPSFVTTLPLWLQPG